jgi:hypothetical protein
MTRTNEDGARLETRAAWSVVVVYEDSAARERAVVFCDQLVTRFWARFEFEVNWWSFAMLGPAAAAKAATENAARANLLVISATSVSDFPAPIKGWIETSLSVRGEREGLLAGLIEPSANPSGWQGQKHNYLRNAAHRAAMDYLTQVPHDIADAVPDSLDSYTRRADEVTSLLDGILRQQAPPPHLLP